MEMNRKNIIRTIILSGLVVFGSTSCSEELRVGEIQAPDETSGVPSLYVKAADGVPDAVPTIEFRDNGSSSFTVNKPMGESHDTNITLAYDAATLDDYNDFYGTEYMPVPESLVSFNENVVIPAGRTESDPVTLNIASNGTLDPDRVYAIPLLISDGNESLGKIFLVKDLTTLNNSDKGDGVKIFSVIDISNTNILNALRYTLKGSGKYMVDAVVLYAGTINYDDETTKVYLNISEDMQYVLDHNDDFIRPLQNRGIKVIMGVSCDFERACVAGLDERLARQFAGELHTLCEVYALDGVLYRDNQYCNHDSELPGFAERGPESFSRLVYEVWKLQPDKWNVVYAYTNTDSAVAVDGVEPGDYVDYVLPHYTYKLKDWSEEFAGVPLSRMGANTLYCEFARYLDCSGLNNMTASGFGAIMVYNMNPFKGSTAKEQDAAFVQMAIDFYNDEAVVDSVVYAKTW